MRIALIGPTYPFRGGISHYNTLLCEKLGKRHQVELFSFCRQYPRWLFPGRDDRDPSTIAFQVPNRPIFDPLWPSSWWRAAQAVKCFDADLLILHWWVPFWSPAFGATVRWSKQQTHLKVVFICHNVLPHESLPGSKWLTCYALAGGDHFIVHSMADQNKLERLLPGASIHRSVLPTFQPLSSASELRDSEQAKSALGLQDKRVALFFGLVRPYKGLENLLQAFAIVLAQIDLHLLIVGEFWEPVQAYQEMIAQLGIEHAVTIVDQYVPNEELGTYFYAADVAVLPYKSATQSAVVQLAFGFGVPVITTDVGGLAEAVRDGETGLVVPPQDSQALAQAMLHYFTQECKPVFTHNIRCDKTFSWDRLIDLIETLV